VASFTGCAITKAELRADRFERYQHIPDRPGQRELFNITAGTFAQFGVGVAATATAGTATGVTLTAEDSDGNTVTSYTGSQSITCPVRRKARTGRRRPSPAARSASPLVRARPR